jgi:hypothetical protein
VIRHAKVMVSMPDGTVTADATGENKDVASDTEAPAADGNAAAE